MFGLEDGYWDGFSGWWGFTQDHLYSYGDDVVSLDRVVWLYFEEPGEWGLVAWNHDYYGYNTGTASNMTFNQIYDDSYYEP